MSRERRCTKINPQSYHCTETGRKARQSNKRYSFSIVISAHQTVHQIHYIHGALITCHTRTIKIFPYICKYKPLEFFSTETISAWSLIYSTRRPVQRKCYKNTFRTGDKRVQYSVKSVNSCDELGEGHLLSKSLII